MGYEKEGKWCLLNSSDSSGYEQIDGVHYDEDTKASPVVNEATILIIFVLMLLAGWTGFIVNDNGAFRHGKFEEKHKMYMAFPKGFGKIYGSGVVLLLQKTLYRTRQAALQFWQELLKTMLKVFYSRSKAVWYPYGSRTRNDKIMRC
jgi:Reverse transcriptase (RNA-dependent DNA polymerase)